MGAKAVNIQSYANVNDTKNINVALKGVYGLNRFSLHPVRSIDGAIVKNNVMILTKWAELLQSLLNKVYATDLGFLDDLPTLSTIQGG